MLLANKIYLFLSLHSSVEDLKSKYCSTVANDIMLVSTLGVIRMWADEASRKSRFRILFTTYQERKIIKEQITTFTLTEYINMFIAT